LKELHQFRVQGSLGKFQICLGQTQEPFLVGTILDHGGYQIRLTSLVPIVFPLATLDHILELSIVVEGGSSHTGSYRFQHFFGMVLQVFKSHNQSWKIGFQILSIPVRPIVGEGNIGYFRVVSMDRYRNRHAVDNEIGAMCTRAIPFGFVRIFALERSNKQRR
jgi:hypothetical protein